MVSQLGWIDFSSEDRAKVKQALDMLSETSTLDELGIGQIRDAFGDLLFPGISTIQTRAKYFIFIPRLLREYQQLSADRHKKQTLQDYLRIEENKLVRQLIDSCSGKESGIIGIKAIDKGGVNQLPSSIYWGGLRKFNIVKTSDSLTEMGKKLKDKENRQSQGHKNDDFDFCESSLFDLPNNDKDWRNKSKLEMQLSADESSFLISKMTETPGLENSVFAQVFASKRIKNKKLICELGFDELAMEILNENEFSATCNRNLKLARDFSLAMVGPHTVFNILLAQANGSDDQVTELFEEYRKWANEAAGRAVFNNIEGWLSVRVDGKSRNIKSHTYQFIRDFADAFQKASDYEKPGDKIQTIVGLQSRKNKGKLSKLNNNSPYDGWVGIERLDFRWSTAKVILKDLLEGGC